MNTTIRRSKRYSEPTLDYDGCRRCGATGVYLHFGVCFGCGGRCTKASGPRVWWFPADYDLEAAREWIATHSTKRTRQAKAVA